MHTIELDADTERRLHDRAELLGESPEALIRRAVTDALRPSTGFAASPTDNLMGALVRILEDLVAENLPPVQVFERVCRVAVEQAGFRLAWIGRLDEEGWLRPEAWSGASERYLEGLVLSDRAEREAGAGPTGMALREGRPVVVQAIHDSPEMAPWQMAAEAHGLRGSAAVPFRHGEAVVGSLQVYAPESHFFTAPILGLLEEIGRAVGTALENHARERERSRLMQVLARLQEMTGDPNTTQSDKIEGLLKLGAEVFGLPYGILSHVRGQDYRIRHATSPDGSLAADQHFPLGHTYCVHTLAAEGPLGFPHVARSTIRTHPCYQVQGMEAYLGVPVHQGEAVYGTLNFSSPEPRAPFSDFEWHLLQLMGQWISDALTREADRQALERERNLFIGGPSVAFVWRLDPGWSVEHVSPNVTANFALTPEQLTDHPFEERIHPDDRDRVAEQMHHHLATGARGFQQEYRLLDGDGSYRWVQDFSVPDRDETGEAVSVRGYLLDITQIKEAEQTRREMARFHRLITMGQIGASLAHQLRQPLTAAGNYAEIARMQLNPNDAEQAASVQSLDKAVAQIDRAEETIQNLRNFLNRGEAALEPTDLNQLVRKRLADIEGLAQRHGIRTEQGLDPELGMVRCDPLQIAEVLLNLCRNAIEAMDQNGAGGGCLRIETEAGEQARLRVCDEGGGLPEAFQEGLVQPFFTTKVDGMGLGIPIAQSLVWANDGLFGAEATDDGRGTCFWLTLPVTDEKGEHHHE